MNKREIYRMAIFSLLNEQAGVRELDDVSAEEEIKRYDEAIDYLENKAEEGDK